MSNAFANQNFNKRRVVGALIWSSDEKLLLGKRMKEEMHGLWQAPGGGVEDNESDEEALARELYEEIGLTLNSSMDVKLIDEEGSDESRIFSMFEVRCNAHADSISIAPFEEFDELRWFSKDELKYLKLVPAGHELLSKLGLV